MLYFVCENARDLEQSMMLPLHTINISSYILIKHIPLLGKNYSTKNQFVSVYKGLYCYITHIDAIIFLFVIVCVN